MSKIVLFISITLFFGYLNAVGQNLIQGKIVDFEDNNPVSFATVVLKNQTGTVCDMEGYFRLPLEKRINTQDSLYISCIGYEKFSISYGEFCKLKEGEISISKQSYQIGPVTIIDKEIKTKYKKYGINKKKSNAYGFVFGDNKPGSIVVLFIDNEKKENGFIQNLNLYITPDGFEPNYRLRLHIYSVNSFDNNPKTELLSENIFIEPQEGDKWISVDVSKFNIKFPEEGFFAGIEYLIENYSNTGKRKQLKMKVTDIVGYHYFNMQIGRNYTWYFSPKNQKWIFKKDYINEEYNDGYSVFPNLMINADIKILK